MNIVVMVLAVIGALAIIALLGMALMHGMMMGGMMGAPIATLASLLILIALSTAVVILAVRRK
jgi:hypothetical protein